MFDWSGKNANKSGKSQGILIFCVSGNPVLGSVQTGRANNISNRNYNSYS